MSDLYASERVFVRLDECLRRRDGRLFLAANLSKKTALNDTNKPLFFLVRHIKQIICKLKFQTL